MPILMRSPMPLPPSFEDRLKLPLIAAPMFLVSGPDLVVECCKAGIVGSFPALNQRDSAGFEAWLVEIERRLSESERTSGGRAAPFGVNLIVHDTNPRWRDDLALCVKHRVPLIITSLGAVSDLVHSVHGYGGVVFHDVINVRHARKAAEAGVDGLILVCAGAGGHAGVLSPFALVPEVRRFFAGTIILAGAISTGQQVAAARVMGADLAYLGTRFICTRESLAPAAYKEMITTSAAADIVYTPAISGVAANFLAASLRQAGLDPARLPAEGKIDFGKELNAEARAWKTIWSAGQGVGSIRDVPAVADLVARLRAEFATAVAETTRLAAAAA
jgi:nitronate monooxygenase